MTHSSQWKRMFAQSSLAGLIASLTVVQLGCGASADTSEQRSAVTVDSSAVLGFESPSSWLATAGGTLTSATPVTQGSGAVGFANFGSYGELTSASLSTLSTVTSTLLLDVKVPATPEWGQIQLYISIPSQGVYNTWVGQASVTGLSPDNYSTLSFAISTDLQAVLKRTYSDLQFKLVVNAPATATPYLLDNLRFLSGDSVVTMQVSGVDDFLYVTVDGVRRKVYYIGDPDENAVIDISSWFAAGTNLVRIQNVNTGGPAGFDAKIWVDGVQVVHDSPTDFSSVGISSDHTFAIHNIQKPVRQTVQVSSPVTGKLYLNNEYTGLSTPAQLTLPAGSYTLGLGVSQDQPFNYTGAFYTKPVVVADASQSVTVGDGSPLPIQKTERVLLLPVQTMYNYVSSLGREDVSNSSVLQPADVDLFAGQIQATNTVWFIPFTYGLSNWDVTVYPMVTNTPLRESSPDGIDMDRFFVEANLTQLRQQYDRVVVYFSQERADGSEVDDSYGAVFALGRQLIGFTPWYVRSVAPNRPNPFFLHESLHTLEASENDISHLYTGVNGLHGATQAGYYGEGSEGETDFVKFYRAYIRSQVAQLDGFRPDIDWPSIPTTADIYVGVFETLPVYTGH